jgi:UDPglucose 6-dehydrogenase
MNVGVIGTGHVGLVAAVSFAEMGHRVVGVDANQENVELLLRGVAPFYEPGVTHLLRKNQAIGRLTFSPRISEGVSEAEVVFICVGTPSRASGEANLAAVERAAVEVVRQVEDQEGARVVLVQKSTVPAGTADRLRRAVRLASSAGAERVDVASNPEFLREGRGVQDSLSPDRILVGSDSVYASQVMRSLYQPLIDKGCEYIETDIHTAELAKHACNAFLAMKISYMNALARVCELAGADVVRVADVMGSDPRIGRAFLDAGLGFGGYCFPKDIQAFEHLASSLGYDFPLLREVARINQEALAATLAKIEEGLWNLEEKRIALLGLSFKPDTDDVRFAPALALGRRLIEEGARVVGYDPQATRNAKEELPELEIATDPYQAAAGAHCLVVCTEWQEFQTLDLHHLRTVMSYPLVVDGRNLFSPQTMAAAGFTHVPTGRPRIEVGVGGRGVDRFQQTRLS